MTFFLAWKNSRLHFRKRLPIAIFLAVAVAVLFLGNTVFNNTADGLRNTYRDSLTGELSLSERSEDGFTLFGSDLPLVGEYFKNPTITNFPDVAYRVSRLLPQAQTLPVLIGGGELSLGRFETVAPFFGASLADYLRFFPGLKVLKGTPPASGRPALFLNEGMYRQLVEDLGREPVLGERFLFAAALDNSFVLREVPFEGVFSYPVSDSLLDRVTLIDDDTARALNGYYGATAEPSQGEADLLEKGSLDDLFSSSEDLDSAPHEGITLEGVSEQLRTQTSAPLLAPDTWNFLLIRGGGSDQPEAAEALQKAIDADRLSVQVRNWRDSAGGNAKVVWFIQWIFNVGLVFVTLVASLIVMNSLSLSVAERTREIGTMRALGSPRSQVARLIGWETILLVTGAGLAGLVLGTLVVVIVSLSGGIAISNPLLASLFGTQRYWPALSATLLVWHAVLGFALGLIAMIVPITKALDIQPVQAMAKE